MQMQLMYMLLYCERVCSLPAEWSHLIRLGAHELDWCDHYSSRIDRNVPPLIGRQQWRSLFNGKKGKKPPRATERRLPYGIT